ANAVAGLTPGPTPPRLVPAMAWCSWSASPQKAWSPKVSYRKILRPSVTFDKALSSGELDSQSANGCVWAKPVKRLPASDKRTRLVVPVVILRIFLFILFFLLLRV